jgi:hypothetical protein
MSAKDAKPQREDEGINSREKAQKAQKGNRESTNKRPKTNR